MRFKIPLDFRKRVKEKEQEKKGGGGIAESRSVMNWMFVSQSRFSPLRSGIICKWSRSSFIINYCNHVRQCYSLLPTCGIHCSRVCTHTCQSVPCLFLLFKLPCITFFFPNYTIHSVALACTKIFLGFLSKRDQYTISRRQYTVAVLLNTNTLLRMNRCVLTDTSSLQWFAPVAWLKHFLPEL